MNYVFNEMVPPLLKDNFNILGDFDRSLLRHEVGISTQQFTTDTPGPVVDDRLKIIRRGNNLTIKRYKYWALLEGVFHPTADTNETREYIMGYSDTKKSEFEKTTSTTVHAGAAVSVFNFSADVKDQLRINESISQTWTSSYKKSINWKYNADTTYVVWGLYDELYAVRDSNLQILDTPGMNVMPINLPPEHIASTFNCLINVHQDRIADAERKVSIGDPKSLADVSALHMSIFSRSS